MHLFFLYYCLRLCVAPEVFEGRLTYQVEMAFRNSQGTWERNYYQHIYELRKNCGFHYCQPLTEGYLRRDTSFFIQTDSGLTQLAPNPFTYTTANARDYAIKITPQPQVTLENLRCHHVQVDKQFTRGRRQFTYEIHYWWAAPWHSGLNTDSNLVDIIFDNAIKQIPLQVREIQYYKVDTRTFGPRIRHYKLINAVPERQPLPNKYFKL